jgi:hypothetical protein
MNVECESKFKGRIRRKGSDIDKHGELNGELNHQNMELTIDNPSKSHHLGEWRKLLTPPGWFSFSPGGLTQTWLS